MEHFADSYALATEPQAITARLIAELPEFAHAGLARIACLFSERALIVRGAPATAFVTGMPNTPGPLRHFVEWATVEITKPLFGQEEPDFLVMFDRALWSALNPVERERVVYHELCHIQPVESEFGVPKLGDDGRPRLRTVPHDVEVFNAETRRYGVEVCQLEEHVLAIVDGENAVRAAGKAGAA